MSQSPSDSHGCPPPTSCLHILFTSIPAWNSQACTNARTPWHAQNMLQEVSQTASPAGSPSKQHSSKSRFDMQSVGSHGQTDVTSSRSSCMSTNSFSSVPFPARSSTGTLSHPQPHKTEPQVTYMTVTTPLGIPPPPTESARGKGSPLIALTGTYSKDKGSSNSNPSGSSWNTNRSSPASPRGVVGGLVSGLTAGFGGNVKSMDSNKSSRGSSAQAGNNTSVFSYTKSQNMKSGHNASNNNSPSMQDQHYDQAKSYSDKEHDKRSSCPASYVHSYPMVVVTTEDSDMRFSCNTTNSHATSEDVSSDCVTDCITDCEPIHYPIVNNPSIAGKSGTYSAMHGKHFGAINIFGGHHGHSSSNSPLPDTCTASSTSLPTTPTSLASSATATIGGLQVWCAAAPSACGMCVCSKRTVVHVCRTFGALDEYLSLHDMIQIHTFYKNLMYPNQLVFDSMY